MRIALCDDELLAQQTLLELVETFGEKRKLRFKIDAFASGEDFLASAQTYDIVFMDIYLTGISGMAAVERLGGSELCQVVFTTVSREHAVEAFGLNAAHYLVKPLTAQTVAAAMERCLSRLGQNPEKFLMVKMGQGEVPVSMGKIVYIEVQDKLCTIHTEKNTFQTHISLDALLKQLDDTFLRAQRSFVVNMGFIESFLSDRVVMQNGTEIMLSRSNKSELKRQYQKFLFRLARKDDL